MALIRQMNARVIAIQQKCVEVYSFADKTVIPREFIMDALPSTDEDADPPVALIIEFSSAALVVVGVIICLGVLMAVSFCILNVVLRNNK